jgi:hypothetical protein
MSPFNNRNLPDTQASATVLRYDECHQVVKSSPIKKVSPMADLGAVLAQLKEERAKLDRAIEALSGITGKAGGGRGRRKLSAEARERIAAAQRARWKKFKAKKG